VLANHHGPLSLNGVKSLTSEVAEALSKHRGMLTMDSITSFSEGVLDKLLRHEGPLSLSAFRSDSQFTSITPSVAQFFVNREGRSTLRLDGLSEISIPVAEVLSTHLGALCLDGLEFLTAEAASALSVHSDSLSINGLSSLSVSVAAALAEHKGKCLQLNGIRNISDDSARALAAYRGTLILDGLEQISYSTAASLASHQGDIFLRGVSSLTDSSINEPGELSPDCRISGFWFLHTLHTFSPGHARIYCRLFNRDFRLNSLTSLSAETASILCAEARYIELDGLSTLTSDVASVFARHRCSVSLAGVSNISDEAALYLLELDKVALKSFSPTTTIGARLLIKSRPLISIALAQAACSGQWLNVDHIKEINTEVASVLVSNCENISLNGLTNVSDSVADIFASHKFRIDLCGLNFLTDNCSRTPAQERLLEKWRSDHPKNIICNQNSEGYRESEYYYDAIDWDLRNDRVYESEEESFDFGGYDYDLESEHELLLNDLADDCDDYANSEEDGWFYRD
jgi:hypothetical protein